MVGCFVCVCMRACVRACVCVCVLKKIGAVCSRSTLFASILNSSVMLGNYLQQTTSADDIFRGIFFLALSGIKVKNFVPYSLKGVGYLRKYTFFKIENLLKKRELVALFSLFSLCLVVLVFCSSSLGCRGLVYSV